MRILSLLIALAFMFGTYSVAESQERQQERQERQGQEQQERMQRHERPVEITDLPAEVQETLREDYEDWRPVDAAIITDPDEHDETFYEVTLHDAQEEERKIVSIARDGEVIDEENGGFFENLFGGDDDENDDARRDEPAYQQEQEQQRRGQQQHQHQEGQRHGQNLEITDLPQEVQEKLREDYEDFRAVNAALVNDPEEHEEPFYQVRLRDMEDDESKIVLITRDGEVIDEKDDDDEGLFDWFDDDDERREDTRRRGRGY